MKRIEPARLRWDNGRPIAERFDDIYYSADGLAEVDRVFLSPSGLAQRFAVTQQTRFTLVEFGFGSGLNFLGSATQWLQATNAAQAAQLHFVSVEKHPLTKSDFVALNQQRQHKPQQTQEATLTATQQTAELVAELCATYPPITPGWHRCYLAQGQIMLSLYWGDVSDALADFTPRQQQPVDAWFLDGFSPAKNPAMWLPSLWPAVAALSVPGTTVATFTAAGHVRRGLIDVGFEMRREDQLPHKHESLAGTYVGPAKPALQAFRPPREVTIVGAGIAGASVARHLAMAGVNSRVLESGTIAGGTSRIPATLLHGRLLNDESPLADLRINSFHYAANFCRGRPGVSATGAIQTATDPAQAQRLQSLVKPLADADWIQPLSAAELGEAYPALSKPALIGLLRPNAATIHPPTLIAHLLQSDRIQTFEQSPFDLTGAMLSRAETDKGPVILACGAAARAHPSCKFLEVTLVGGQLDLVEYDGQIPTPLTGQHYVVPAPPSPTAGQQSNRVYLGSTYEHAPWSPAQASAKNLSVLQDRVKHLGYVRGLRCISSDRNPILGAIPEPSGTPSLWVSLAQGSMGMVSAHLGAAIISSYLTGTFPPISQAEEDALAPNRFHERQQRRGPKLGAIMTNDQGK